MYTPKVFDVRPDNHGSFGPLPKLAENEFDRLQEFYKFELDFTHGYDLAQPGEFWFGIYAIEVKSGPAVFQPQVRDINNNLILTTPGILLWNHWPSAATPAIPPDPPYHPNAVGGFTMGDGTLGWGYGGDSHITEDGGPHTFWASADPPDVPNRRVGSDALKKVGWFDEHVTPNVIFRVMQKEVTTPSGNVRLVIYDNSGQAISEILGTSGVGGGGRIAIEQDNIEISHVLSIPLVT